MKILIVFGTRPEAIKMAPVIAAFKKRPESFKVKVCTTSQHREMLDQVLELFEIVPDHDLNIMKPGQDLFDITTNILQGLKLVLGSVTPDVVLVHGDTSTTFGASLAAFYNKIPVGHVEAGLRSGNILSPWPEEANRKLTTQLCQYHFAPTEENRQNLLKEGISEKNVVVTGNTVIDALGIVLEKIRHSPSLEKEIQAEVSDLIEKNILSSKYILVTGHRRENFGKGLADICEAIKDISALHPNLNIVYPVHLNPNVRSTVYEQLSDRPNIFLCQPLAYHTFTYLMYKSWLILTDSGGIQEEAPSLGKPVLVMRDTTERKEGVTAGTVKIVGTSPSAITSAVNELFEDHGLYAKMSQAQNPYGDGNAAEKIINFFLTSLPEADKPK